MAQTVRIDIPIKTIDKTEPGLSNVTKKLDKMSSAMKKAGESVDRTREKISRFDKSAEKTQRNLEKWAKDKYKILLEVEERITPVLGALGSSIMNLTGKTWHVTMKAVDLVSSPVRGILGILRNAVSQMGEAASVAGSLQYSIEGAALSLGRMANAGEKDYNKLTKAIKNAAGASSEMDKMMSGGLTGAVAQLKGTLERAKRSLGETLKSGLSGGISNLLGINVSGMQNEFAGIGASFAAGFMKGFDFEAISTPLYEGFNKILGNVSKMLPANEASGSSSNSVLKQVKEVTPLISSISGGINIAKALGSAVKGDGILGKIGKKVLGSAGQGTGILGFGANTAINLGAGNLPGNASLSVGALSGVGLGSVAGGVAGVAGLVHGAMDLYEGFTSDNSEKAEAYTKAGAVEMIGVGSGALAGAAIGSVVPVVGTAAGALIGAGVGAIGSWIAGNKIKDDYEEEEAERQKALINQQKSYDVLGMDIDDVKFKTKELNEALHDSETSTEEFAKMYQEALGDDLKQHFGEVTFSLEEIQNIADKVVLNKDAKNIQKYSEAASKTSSSQTNLNSSSSELDKQNWKVSFGMKLDEAEREEYRTAVDNFVEDARTYLEDSHYQATMSVELLLGKEGSQDITGVFDQTYTSLEAELNELAEKLRKKREAALADGVIDEKEQKEISGIQDRISSVTNKVSDANERASMNALKTKFMSGNMDASSFSSLQQELAARTQSTTQEYYGAMQNSFASLELAKGDMSDEEYQEKYKEIQDAYKEKIDALSDRTVDFQFDVVKDSYGNELEGILPELEGTTTDKLKQAMDNAFMVKPNVSLWENGDITKWFGLEDVEEESRGNLISMIRGIAESVPEDQRKTAEERFQDTIPTVDQIKKNINFTQISGLELNKMNGFTLPEFSFPRWGESFDLTKPVLTGNEADYDQRSTEYAESIQRFLENSKDEKRIQSFVKDYMSGPVAEVDGEKAEAVQSAEKENGYRVVTSDSENFANSTDEVRGTLENTITTAAATPFSPDVTVSPNYHVTPFDSNQFFGKEAKSDKKGFESDDKDLSKKGFPVDNNKENLPAKKNASGGFATGKQLSWLAEEGYGEWIIPTNPSRRSRALELYKQAGRSLGVGEHADGGFASPYGEGYEMSASGSDSNETNAPYASRKGDNGSENNTTIELNVSVNPEFTVNGAEGKNSEDVVGVIRRHIRELADELGGEIASQLEASFSNRPLKEA
ncbi:MAG: hypothetical protein HFG34_02405 [Eubacterium sp.]|nr:hypothetical protein [Eubacterium sp.]